MTQRRARAPRHTLDRSTIAAAALELMDRDGVAALTIRSLAARLGVAPMALYTHVSTKEDILDAAREHGLARLPGVEPGTPTQGEAGMPAQGEASIPAQGEASIPAQGEAGTPAQGEAGTPAQDEASIPAQSEAGGHDPDRAAENRPWWEHIREINLTFHRALREHPSLVALLVARPLGGHAPTGAAEAQLRVLVEAGFSPDDAARAHLTLLHYAIGAAAWTSPRVEPAAVGRAALERLPADRYPTMAALAAPLARASYHDDQYAYGLDLLLTALRATSERQER
ncbi:TetR/AcrR family transcriptional regulator [Planosporangium sp. 12N6]|uniref:TetR/AcrR family transcriptional regulator n=1 Tax=Planosporangium spinosum TaxID=3402278 RepID=UPI003CE86374